MNPVSHSRIDEEILSITPDSWVKVAYVVGRVDLALRNVELDLIAKRIEALIEDGSLVAQGNVKKWRYSEVRRRHHHV